MINFLVSIIFVLKNPLAILRHLICERRYSRTGERKFLYILSEELPPEKGGGFKRIASITIKVGILDVVDMWDDKVEHDIFADDKTTYQYYLKTAWQFLIQKHQQSLIKGSDVITKEVI